KACAIQKLPSSEKNGPARRYLPPSTNTGASSFYQQWKLGSAHQLVVTKRLDDLLRDMDVTGVRLVKVDCEGAEGLVLSGAADAVRRQIVGFCVVDDHSHITGVEKCESAHALLRDAGCLLRNNAARSLYFLQ